MLLLQARKQACKIAKTAFDEAIVDLTSLPKTEFKDAHLILQVDSVRDNYFKRKINVI
jgi:14-3-3 protein beta/theta/zeta